MTKQINQTKTKDVKNDKPTKKGLSKKAKILLGTLIPVGVLGIGAGVFGIGYVIAKNDQSMGKIQFTIAKVEGEEETHCKPSNGMKDGDTFQRGGEFRVSFDIDEGYEVDESNISVSNHARPLEKDKEYTYNIKKTENKIEFVFMPDITKDAKSIVIAIKCKKSGNN